MSACKTCLSLPQLRILFLKIFLNIKNIIKEYPSKKINIGRLKTHKKNAINTVKIKSENKIIIELNKAAKQTFHLLSF